MVFVKNSIECYYIELDDNIIQNNFLDNNIITFLQNKDIDFIDNIYHIQYLELFYYIIYKGKIFHKVICKNCYKINILEYKQTLLYCLGCKQYNNVLQNNFLDNKTFLQDKDKYKYKYKYKDFITYNKQYLELFYEIISKGKIFHKVICKNCYKINILEYKQTLLYCLECKQFSDNNITLYDFFNLN